MLEGFYGEPRVVDGWIWQPQNDGIAGATIIRLADFSCFAFSATPVAGGPRVIRFVSQCTIPQPGEEFLIRNPLQSREISCYAHQHDQSFLHSSSRRAIGVLQWPLTTEGGSVLILPLGPQALPCYIALQELCNARLLGLFEGNAEIDPLQYLGQVARVPLRKLPVTLIGTLRKKSAGLLFLSRSSPSEAGLISGHLRISGSHPS